MGLKITLTEVGVKTCALKLAYLKTIPAILKILEMIIATVILSTVTYYINEENAHSISRVNGDFFFLVTIVTFFICILCLFLSEWIIWSNVEANSKSMFEIIFYVVSVILILSSSINLFTSALKYSAQDSGVYVAYLIMTSLGILLIGLYSTDILLNLCLTCCEKKRTKSVEIN